MIFHQESEQAPRYKLSLNVKFRKNYSRDESQGQLKNISLTGAFLEGNPEELHMQDKLYVTLNVSGRERTLHCKVVWKNKTGCGIQFAPFNNQDIQIVDDLIYFIKDNSEKRKVVLREIFKKVA